MRTIHVPGPSGGIPGAGAGRGGRGVTERAVVVESLVERQEATDHGEGDDVERVEDAHDQQDPADPGDLVLELLARRLLPLRRGATNVTVNRMNDVKMK